MATIYVRSTDGSDADDGSTWALAKATLAGAAASALAGDTIYVSQAHTETQAAALTLTIPGTAASPCNVVCVDDSAEPPTAVAESAYSETTGANTLTLGGAFNYLYGLILSGASGAVNSNLNIATGGSQWLVLEKCALRVGATGGSARIYIGSSNNVPPSRVTLKNCTAKFAGANNVIAITSTRFAWDGGSFEAGTASPSGALFRMASSGEGHMVEISGVDFSALGASLTFFNMTGQTGRAMLRNCKLPASWSGSLVDGIGYSARAEMHNCDSGDTNYAFWIEGYAGSIKPETTLVRTGGASDGTTPIAWKMETNADARYPLAGLDTQELPAVWNDTVGSPITITVEVLHDSVTPLTDAEIALEVQYLGTSGAPLSSFASDAKANILATAANQASSSETWTTTGMSNPNKQKLSVTVTPQEAGYIQGVVTVWKASKVVYLDPKMTVS
jgi:hypothetical protein